MFSHHAISSTECVIVYNHNPSDANGSYCKKLLQEVILPNAPEFPCTLKEIRQDSQGEATQQRVSQDVQYGELTVMWAATEPNLESTLIPIRIDIFKGLFGARVLMMNTPGLLTPNNHGVLVEAQASWVEDEKQKYHALSQKLAKVSEVHDFSRLGIRFGQGRTWADTDILEANNLIVVKTTKYQSLFYKLGAGRFDVFPRGIHEPFGEIERLLTGDWAFPDGARETLEVDQNLLLLYPNPYFLFISPTRPDIAKYIELGLERAMQNGSFDAFFYQDTRVKIAFEKGNFQGRRVIQLSNPYLTPETLRVYEERKDLFLDFDALTNNNLSFVQKWKYIKSLFLTKRLFFFKIFYIIVLIFLKNTYEYFSKNPYTSCKKLSKISFPRSFVLGKILA